MLAGLSSLRFSCAVVACVVGVASCSGSGPGIEASGPESASKDASSPDARPEKEDAGGALQASVDASSDRRDGHTPVAPVAPVLPIALLLCDAALGSQPMVDGGIPPADCIAPCVWDLIKDCLSKGPCGEASLWRKVLTPSSAGGRYGYDMYLGDRLCYHYSYVGIPPTGSAAGWSWLDGAGQTVAWGFSAVGGSAPYSTSCGPMCIPVPDAPCDEPSYEVDPRQAHCAAWRELYEF